MGVGAVTGKNHGAGEPTIANRERANRYGRTVPGLVGHESPAQDREVSLGVDLESIRDRARTAARTALGLKADDVRILDVHELVTYTDFLVLCTGRNARLTRRIAEEVAFTLKGEANVRAIGTEGVTGGEWILLDFMDFIVHVFTPKARDFYRLDVLWKQAPAETLT